MIDEYKIKRAARQISEKVVDANGFDNSKPTHLAFLEGIPLHECVGSLGNDVITYAKVVGNKFDKE